MDENHNAPVVSANLPDQEKAILGLALADQACRELARAHAPDCGCDLCADAHHFAFALELFQSVLDSQLRHAHRWPEEVEGLFWDIARREPLLADEDPRVEAAFHVLMDRRALGAVLSAPGSKNHPAHERAIVALSLALEACYAVDASHGQECDCPVCADASHVAYIVKLFLDLLEGAACFFPFTVERERHRIDERRKAGESTERLNQLEEVMDMIEISTAAREPSPCAVLAAK
jgi:hypothetical protein